MPGQVKKGGKGGNLPPFPFPPLLVWWLLPGPKTKQPTAQQPPYTFLVSVPPIVLWPYKGNPPPLRNLEMHPIRPHISHLLSERKTLLEPLSLPFPFISGSERLTDDRKEGKKPEQNFRRFFPFWKGTRFFRTTTWPSFSTGFPFSLFLFRKPIRNTFQGYFKSKIKFFFPSLFCYFFVEKSKCSVIQGLNQEKNVLNPIFRHRQNPFF